MSYLDDLVNGGAAACSADAGEEAQSPAHVVRNQIEAGPFEALRVTDTRYKACGTSYGVGFAEGDIVLDEERGTCSFDIDTHIPVPAELHKAFDRFCRHVNGAFIVRGFALANGTLHFTSEIPTDVLHGGDVAEDFSRAMSSIHRHAEDFSLMLAGVNPWDVIEASKKQSSEGTARLSALRSMLGDLD